MMEFNSNDNIDNNNKAKQLLRNFSPCFLRRHANGEEDDFGTLSLTSFTMSQEKSDLLFEFLDSLRSNKSIKVVHLSGWFYGTLSQKAKTRLLEAIGDLVNLKELYIHNSNSSRDRDRVLSLDAIASILFRAKNLAALSVEGPEHWDAAMAVGGDEAGGSNNNTSNRRDEQQQQQQVADDGNDCSFLRALENLKFLRRIYLVRLPLQNNIHRWTALASCLGKLPMLEEVCFGSHTRNHGGTTTTSICANAISFFLNNKKTLKSLMLPSLGFSGDEVSDVVGRIVQTSTSLESLSISGSDLGGASCLPLARALGTVPQQGIQQLGTTLRTLDLTYSRLDDSTGVAIARALEAKNSALETLVLTANNLGSETGFALGKTLRWNKSLRCLKIAWNQLDDDAVVEIAASLRLYNRTLQELDLDCCDNKGLNALVEMLQENFTLRILRTEQYSPVVDFYLKLNHHHHYHYSNNNNDNDKRGVGTRQHLLQNSVTQEEWIDALLLFQKTDISCFFYLLQANPALCSAATATLRE